MFEIYHADPHWGPVHLAKIDISDGFYNVTVNSNGVKQFGTILPTPPGHEPLVLFFLLRLPIGWVPSPPIFCAATELVVGAASASINANWRPPAHCLNDTINFDYPSTICTLLFSSHSPSPQGPLGKTDVYIDDSLLMCQGGHRGRRHTVFYSTASTWCFVSQMDRMTCGRRSPALSRSSSKAMVPAGKR